MRISSASVAASTDSRPAERIELYDPFGWLERDEPPARLLVLARRGRDREPEALVRREAVIEAAEADAPAAHAAALRVFSTSSTASSRAARSPASIALSAMPAR